MRQRNCAHHTDSADKTASPRLAATRIPVNPSAAPKISAKIMQSAEPNASPNSLAEKDPASANAVPKNCANPTRNADKNAMVKPSVKKLNASNLAKPLSHAVMLVAKMFARVLKPAPKNYVEEPASPENCANHTNSAEKNAPLLESKFAPSSLARRHARLEEFVVITESVERLVSPN